MKALVVYESFFHNTETIAKAIGKGLSTSMDAQVMQFEDVRPENLAGLNLLVIGSPTQRFGPTDEIVKFLKAIPAGALKAVPVAVFDTRLDTNVLTNKLFRMVLNYGGYAGKRLMQMLLEAGAKQIGNPEGFLVLGQEGPLKPGEVDRAEQWAANIAKQAQ